MLSISNIASSKVAESYYDREDYYTSQENCNSKESSWYGKGALKLKLEGTVKVDDFKKILRGVVSDDVKLGKYEKGGALKHAAGIDLTFSAPKSVSIMAEVYKDSRILEAHNRAVNSVLDYIEENLVKVRVVTSKHAVRERADNIIVAKFNHDSSRLLDPQLHTHCVLMNIVQRNNEEWRSACFKEVFENKMLLGQLYRFKLAYQLREIGYNITLTSNDSRFELSAVPESMLREFSKRSIVIAKKVEEYSKDYSLEIDAKLKAQATLVTRPGKINLSKDEINRIWQNTAQEYPDVRIPKIENSNHKTIIGQIKLYSNNIIHAVQRMLFDRKILKADEKIIRFAVDHCAEQLLYFSKAQVMKIAMGYSTGMLSYQKLEFEFSNFVRHGELLMIRKNHIGSELYASRVSLEREKKILKLLKEGNRDVVPLLENSLDEYQMISAELNSDQLQSLKHILSCNNRFYGIQGYAGTGKTRMLECARQILEHGGHNIVGLAPSASAARSLEDGSGIKTETLQRFLAKYESIISKNFTYKQFHNFKQEVFNSLIIVDEASMISTSQMLLLMQLTKISNSRLLLVGDVKQLKSVGPGLPFAFLQKNGLETVKLGKIIRQRNNTLRGAVYDTINSEYIKAVNRLENSIRCRKSNMDERTLDKIVVQEWSDLPESDRKVTLLVCPSNELRHKINCGIRQALIERGEISKGSRTIKVLDSERLSEVQKRHPLSYRKDQIVYFTREFKRFNISKGSILKVLETNKYGVVKLINDNGQKFIFQPQKISQSMVRNIEIYRMRELSIAIGDTIRFMRNSTEHKPIINGSSAKITNLSGQNCSIVLDNNQKFNINLQDNLMRFIDYGYCITVNASQGKTSDKVIAVVESNHKFLTNPMLFYVAISRAKYDVTVITDDKEQLKKNLQISKPQVDSIYEMLPKERANYKSTKEVDKWSIKDIYEQLYDKLPEVLPEFGFVKRGDYFVSTSNIKIDGSTGKRGKVYVYRNNPGQLVDYTRSVISVWDYVSSRHLMTSEKSVVMKYLSDLIGGNSPNRLVVPTSAMPKISENKFVAKDVQKIYEDLFRYAKDQLFCEKYNPVMTYLLKDRGYSLEQVRKMDLGYIDKHEALEKYLNICGYNSDQISKCLDTLNLIGKSHNLIVPLYDENTKIIGFAARDINYNDSSELPKYLYSKGLQKSNTLFGIHMLSDKSVLIVEGIFDMLHAHSKGENNVLALGGTSFNEMQLKLLEARGVNKISLCLDNDEAGKIATSKIVDFIKKNTSRIDVNVMALPSKYKDLDDLLKCSPLSSLFSAQNLKNVENAKISDINRDFSKSFSAKLVDGDINKTTKNFELLD